MNIEQIKQLDASVLSVNHFIVAVKNSDMGFQSGKPYALYSGSLAGEKTSQILDGNQSFFKIGQTKVGKFINSASRLGLGTN